MRATIGLHRTAHLSTSPPAFLQHWHDAHRRYYPRFLSGELAYETTARARIREAVSPGLSDEEADRLFAGYLADYEAGWSVFADVVPCLDRLTSCRLGIISNGRASEQRRKLASTGIDQRFEQVIISEDCECAKPNPQIFHRACELVQVSPADAVYVGDQYELDACAARSAGLRGVWLDRGGLAAGNHHGSVISSLKELIGILEMRPSNTAMEPTRVQS